ncbi:la-related protein 7 isoform X2 [Nilaparvata lugens]|uniref:la-related protein 7 isoform X2 n=1 Tax=Nilaparvata lugens TaxID=108931 RepID=UPI00193DA1A9|nr:la-related protein 7 isoform X2 [Nilaparvata lugens]
MVNAKRLRNVFTKNISPSNKGSSGKKMGEESEKTDKEEPKAADVPKKSRGRKKLQYQTLKKQMEFYFSAANLSKDRFLAQLLKDSKYVDLNVFLNFNKIKSLTDNIKDIANAIQSSDLLQLTECGTKVCRVKPLEQKQNSEECTIYVENIPAKTDHDFLSVVFSVYGEIDYVSIPRFKISKKNKGFAFIEFKEPESVEKAITAFKGFGNHLLDKIEPAQLCSIKTFNEEKELENAKNLEKTGTHHKRFDEDDGLEADDNVDQVKTENKVDETDCSNKNSAKEEVEDKAEEKSEKEERKRDKKKRKVKLETESSDEPKAKKTKKEESESESHSSKNKRKISAGSDQETGNESEKIEHIRVESGDEQPKKKKKKEEEAEALESHKKGKKKKKKKKNKKKCSMSGGESESENVKERELENDTHTGREEDILFRQDQQETDNFVQETSNNEDEFDEFDTDMKKKHRKRNKSKREKAYSTLQIMTKKEWKVMRNKYLNEQKKRMGTLKKHLQQKRWEYYNSNKEENMEETEVKQEEKPQNEKSSDGKVSYQAGIIVKIVMDEPIADKDAFKNDLKRKPDIKYIDVKECSNTAHLRFASTEAAQQFVQNSTWSGTTVLEGSEEQDYWDKVWKDREAKINKNIRKPKNGRKKLLEKAEKMQAMMHIRFD